jgi:hypothetical protein
MHAVGNTTFQQRIATAGYDPAAQVSFSRIFAESSPNLARIYGESSPNLW